MPVRKHIAYVDKFLMLEVTATEKYDRQYVNKIPREEFDKAVALDPTSKGEAKVGKYVDWIIRNKAYDDDSVTELLQLFDKHKDKFNVEHKDINKLSFDDLVDVMAEYHMSGELISKKDKESNEAKLAKKESKVVFEDSKYVVITPLTMDAICYWGSGAKWCTANRDYNRNMFTGYHSDDTPLYIVINKSTKDKWQMYKSANGSGEYKDIDNLSFDPMETFGHDPEMKEWLEKMEFVNVLTEKQKNELIDEIRSNFKVHRSYAQVFLDTVIESYADADEYGQNYDDLYYEIFGRGDHYLYNFETAVELLAEKGFNMDIEENRNILIGCLYGGNVVYEIERKGDEYEFLMKNLIPYNLEAYLKQADPNDENIEEFIDGLEQSLEGTYKQDPDGLKDAFEMIHAQYPKMNEKEEEHIKELIDKVAKVEYGKEDHPKLQLSGRDRYLEKIV